MAEGSGAQINSMPVAEPSAKLGAAAGLARCLELPGLLALDAVALSLSGVMMTKRWRRLLWEGRLFKLGCEPMIK